MFVFIGAYHLNNYVENSHSLTRECKSETISSFFFSWRPRKVKETNKPSIRLWMVARYVVVVFSASKLVLLLWSLFRKKKKIE